MRPSQSASFCESQSASRKPSQGVLASGTPTYGTYGTDGESGCERDQVAEVDAHASSSPKSLAYLTPCRYCDDEIAIALCRDGKWRAFDTATVPPAPSGVWAWRKTWGMEEQELVHGQRLHYCANYDRPNVAPWDRGRR